MVRKDLVRLLPCLHLVHKECAAPIVDDGNGRCPICREDIEDKENFVRKKYARTSERDRELIVECSNKGEDWPALARTLGVKYKTAYSWIRSGDTALSKRGGAKPRALTAEHVAMLLQWLEEDCTLTLVKLRLKLLNVFNVIVSTSCVANYLNGQLYTTKKYTGNLVL